MSPSADIPVDIPNGHPGKDSIGKAGVGREFNQMEKMRTLPSRTGQRVPCAKEKSPGMIRGLALAAGVKCQGLSR